jgi:NADH-quinone oxidoreductase subunit G
VADSIKGTLDKYGPEGIAVIASPQMTNEELFGIRQLFQDRLKIETVAYNVPQKEEAYSDDILIKADKNPNSKGASVFFPSAAAADSLLQACSDGRIHLLYIFHHDLTVGYDPEFIQSALSKVEQVVFQGSWNNNTATLATAVLPAAVYAEKEGTFTNFEGRVQRIRPAVEPAGASRPDLDIIVELAATLGAKVPKEPERVFDEISKSVEAFSGMTYASVGNGGQPLKQETGK